jgi:stage II sporulation protein D
MTPVTLTERSRSSTRSTQGLSFALLCECLGDLCVSIRAPGNRRYGCITFVIACVVALYWYSPSNRFRPGAAANTHVLSASEMDDALQRAANNALGPREGTIIVMDPQTGRVRAVVNPQIAFAHSYPPGSTIKPFTALAALRAGLIDKDSRTLCRSEYSRAGFAIACTHPKDLPPFGPAEALAYSCNYYFGALGERLSEASLSDTLSSFGFGNQTGINTDVETAGQLLRGKRDPRNSVGEGEYLQATPIQLLTAYSALVNGGRLFTPQITGASGFHAQSKTQLEIAAAQRSLIIEGMRGAVRYGTAEHAGLESLPLYIFGKTGTSTQVKGFRTHGWFVGFASDPAATVDPTPESVELAVLVLLYKGHGAHAAEIAKPILAEYARLRDSTSSGRGDTETGGRRDVGTQASETGQQAVIRNAVSVPPRPSVPVSAVRVHLVRENITKEVPLEDYILGVLAAEGSTEDQPEALKALAIAARTFAAKNRGRHADDGYDFCTTTHCQRFVYQANVRPRPSVVAAVRETNGMVLRDESGQLVDSYFSASCGGATANMQTLWGVRAPNYLRGVRDEYCATMPHHSWTDMIPAGQLLKALRSDARTDPGTRLADVVVTRRDATGRAESITIEGEHRRTVSGWDFKIIVGRALGWNLLKSSRFEIARLGSSFVFRGSGFGHGLGLCQEGAHVMAQRGASYSRILAKYFPGTSVAGKNDAETRGHGDAGIQPASLDARLRGKPGWQADILPSLRRPITPSPRPRVSVSPHLRVSVSPRLRVSVSPLLPVSPSPRLSISSQHFRISYPGRVEQRDVEHILATLESTRADLLRRVAAASVSVNQFPSLEVFINDTTGDFVARTGQPWWAAAATKGKRIELQPVDVLKRRGVLETTLRHELAHPLIDRISKGRAPRWLAEGLALYLAGEGPMISRYAPRSGTSVNEIEQQLTRPGTVEDMRAAYAAAYREVQALIKRDGESTVLRMVAGISE